MQLGFNFTLINYQDISKQARESLAHVVKTVEKYIYQRDNNCSEFWFLCPKARKLKVVPQNV